MPRKRALKKNDPPPHWSEDLAWTLFVALDVAQARGEYSKAAEVQRQLRELGWVVTRRRSQSTAGEAVGQ